METKKEGQPENTEKKPRAEVKNAEPQCFKIEHPLHAQRERTPFFFREQPRLG